LTRIGKGLGDLNTLSVAVPQSVPVNSKAQIPITSIGICAGSGGSMLNGLDVDMLFTGELSHHEALAAIEQGKVVVTAFHSNTEREYLKQRMINELSRHIDDEYCGVGKYDLAVSKIDRDPFEVVIAGAKEW
jgi:putative NIF3 family GTP cyclohydrolase 1 type 2